jgi:DnaJ homolog subfamily C member 2
MSGSCTPSAVAHFHDFDGYVSDIVGSPISTGINNIDFDTLSEDFRKQVALDLEEQKKRFAEEDRKLAEYIATLPKKDAKKATDTSASASTEEEDDDADFDESLLELDPVEYRKHDLYKVLGLEKRRWLATPEEIKAAYRRRVVKHHPDKLKQNPRRKALNNPNLEDDSFFKLIQKAWQVLTDPGRKADFDACEPTFDESVPEDREYANEEEFIATFAPVFERNARFSKKQPVPTLGTADSPRTEVDAFYSFWINVESWRRFEWLDEDEPAGTDNRADKRWHEKKNKAKRDTRKKDDNTRLIRLVETAMKRDPRMIRWKEADRAAKAAKKNSKVDAAKAVKEAEAARKAAEAAEKAAKEAAEKAIKESAAASKAAAKAALKSGRKAFRDALGSLETWAVDLVAEIRTVQALGMTVERVLSAIGEDTDRLARVTESINCMITNFNGDRRGHLVELSEFLATVESNTESSVQSTNASTPAVVAASTETAPAAASASVTWEMQEIDLLINAVKQYPGGTSNRWEQITSTLNRQLSHLNASARTFTLDQVIAQTNQLQANKDTVIDSDEAQTMAALNCSKKKRDPRVDMAEPTIASHYFDTTDATEEKENTSSSSSSSVSVWTPEDQLALESALKTVPADDAARWDRVAELVPGKNKKECVARVKEIAAMLKAKK